MTDNPHCPRYNIDWGKDNSDLLNAGMAFIDGVYRGLRDVPTCQLTRRLVEVQDKPHPERQHEARNIRAELAKRQPVTEPTEQGNQYVIPGCERDQSRGPAQMRLW